MPKFEFVFINFELEIFFQDFVLTGILAFFWLIGTIGFSSGGSALKKTFDENYIGVQCKQCVPSTSSFTDLRNAYVSSWKSVFNFKFLNSFVNRWSAS